jgi:hypothetical protein
VTLEDNGWSLNKVDNKLNIISGFRLKMEIHIFDRDNKLYSDENFALISVKFVSKD